MVSFWWESKTQKFGIKQVDWGQILIIKGVCLALTSPQGGFALTKE